MNYYKEPTPTYPTSSWDSLKLSPTLNQRSRLLSGMTQLNSSLDAAVVILAKQGLSAAQDYLTQSDLQGTILKVARGKLKLSAETNNFSRIKTSLQSIELPSTDLVFLRTGKVVIPLGKNAIVVSLAFDPSRVDGDFSATSDVPFKLTYKNNMLFLIKVFK